MAELVRVKLDNGTEKTVGASYAQSHGLKVLDKPAVDGVGRTVRDKRPVDLRGKALDEALTAAGLPTTGKADQKRARLAEHLETTGAAGAGDTTDGGTSAQS